MANNIIYKQRFLVSIICFAISIFVAFCDVPKEGLSLLFLLPLSFAISFLFFAKEYSYCTDSFGLMIVYAECFVRYIITPCLIVISQSVVDTLYASNEDYLYAIIVEIFEIFVVMLAIRYIWPKHLKKLEKLKIQNKFNPNTIDFHLSWTGFLFVAFLVILIISRGHWGNIVSHLSTWFYRINNREDLFTYDLMAFNVIKTVLFLLLVSFAKKIHDKTSLKTFSFLIALTAGLLNTNFYIYNQRTDLAILVIASFFVLRYAFPKNKTFLKVLFGVGGILFVGFIFMEGTLKYEAGSSVLTVAMANYAKSAELYTTGPSVIANAHMNYDVMRSQFNIMSFAKDIVKSCDVFSLLPFLRFVGEAVSGVKYSVEIYVSTVGFTYIIPNHSLASLYVGDVLCWLLEPLFIILNVILLGWVERGIYRINDLVQVYAVVSIVTRVATGFYGNNFQLMLHSFSSLPLWLLFFSYVNYLGNHKIKLKA